jgi:hypothetical protein
MPTGEVEPTLHYAGSGATGCDSPHRPVEPAQLPRPVLSVTSDASGVILAVGSGGD